MIFGKISIYLNHVSVLKKRLLNNSFINNLSWLSGAEMFIRISRLATTVVLARNLSPHDYGLAALVSTTYEFTNVFTTTGINAKIVQADEKDLSSLCTSAYWLNWVVFSCLFIVQCIAAFPVAWFYHDNELIIPICCLALTYFMGPIGNIQAGLIERENRLKIIAIGNALQQTTANLLSVALALLGFGMWAIVLPRILAFPISILINFFNHPWRVTEKFTTTHWREIFNYGRNILGLSLLKTLRNNLDYLIVGRFIGINALGVYYFAFNAGLGISMTIINNISASLFPHLCKLRSNFEQFKKGYFKVLRVIALIIVPFVLLQTSFAQIYVPVIFGEKWIEQGAIPILILICFSAIPRPFSEAATILLISVGKPEISLRCDFLFTIFFALALLIGTQYNIYGVALAVVLSHFAFIPLYSLWTSWFVFRKTKLT